MKNDQAISVIIPTLATTERGDFLFRALDSILSQQEVRATPLVIVNGSDYDPEILRRLTQRTDIITASIEEASMPAAIKAGRDMVNTPYFSELDDDDILLPEALKIRLRSMEADPEADVVITNGIVSNEGREEIHISDFSEIREDPLGKLQDGNWFLPGSALFRSETITRDLFEGMPKYLEWTYLAIRLSLEKRILFVDSPTVVHYTDHPFSIWKSVPCTLGKPQALEQILKLEMPLGLRRGIEKTLANANYKVSRLYLEDCRYRLACSYCIKTLKCRSGWKLLPSLIKHYARRLLLSSRAFMISPLFTLIMALF